MPKSVSLNAADAFVRDAKRMDSVPPTVVGYGITSDPIRNALYDAVFAATQLTVKESWQTINVEKSGCIVRDCNGYIQQTMTLRASGERVTERITINEEMGEINYIKCDASGKPGVVECVFAIHTLRVHWKAPYQMAQDTFPTLCR